MLIAQTGEVQAWASVISTIANMGFSALVGWYLLTKAGPSILASFQDSLKTERDNFNEIDERRRSEHKETLDLVIKHCERESTLRDTVLKAELTIVSKSLTDVGVVMEEVRDYLRAKNHAG